MILLLAFTCIPIVYAIYLSFFRTQLVGGTHFVGFGNFSQLFEDPNFWDGFGHVLEFMTLYIPITFTLSMISALALDSSRLHGAKFFRIGLYLPYAVPGVVGVLIWGYMYGPSFGLTGSVNHLLGTHLNPLGGGLIIASIANISTWEYLGYSMLIFYAALQVIDPCLYEAAAIDGAGTLRTIWSIKLPAIRGAMLVSILFGIIGSSQLFTEPQLIQQLAPNAIDSHFTPNFYAYSLAFNGQEYNYAAALAIVMGIITGIVAFMVQNRGTRRENR